jgi:hypothetical protein
MALACGQTEAVYNSQEESIFEALVKVQTRAKQDIESIFEALVKGNHGQSRI